MASLIISVVRPTAVVIISRLLNQLLESERHAWTRNLFNLRRDVPYVAFLLVNSMLPTSPYGFWQLHSLAEARDQLLDPSNVPRTAWEARYSADQLLLLLGAEHPKKERWGKLPDGEIEELKKIGGLFYSVAAEMSENPEREDLESMSENFHPWTEVLSDFGQNPLLIT